MNARTKVRLGSLIGAGLASVVLAACDQPRPKCSVFRGTFAATYELVSGSGDCAELTGDVLGVQAYNPQTSQSDKTPNYDQASIGIQPDAITQLLSLGATDENAADKPYALGKFSTAEPGSDDFCVAPKLSTARLRLPEVPEQSDGCTTTPAQPAVDVEYVWSDVRVYVTTAALGTQFAAKLKYTKDGCTAQYRVQAVYPVVSCNAAPPPEPAAEGDQGDAAMSMDEDAGAEATDAGAADDAGVAMCPPPAAPEPEPVVDETLCSPVADPEQGRAIGSGLSPDFAIRCDPDLLLCVLRKPVPSLR